MYLYTALFSLYVCKCASYRNLKFDPQIQPLGVHSPEMDLSILVKEIKCLYKFKNVTSRSVGRNYVCPVQGSLP